ncbi:MAG: pyruvate, phosphate dikinase [Deltaproteobacteria bacterium]|nr:MAG: pyruvate, phosphate dikinase [Deltaproteobacteria bacterium]
MPRYVYRFGAGEADGRADQRDLLGGKGANLAEMTALGIPVPPGFTITTDVCAYYYAHDQTYPDGLDKQVAEALARVGDLVGARFGDPDNPLLVSVRSGAPVSMPGMMDTILNLGLCDATVQGLAAQTGDARFAYDCYRRFVAMYGEVVMGVTAESESEPSPFERLLEAKRAQVGVDRDTDLPADALKSLVTDYKIEILRRTESQFPEDPVQQLWGAIGAVFRSWQTPRARIYREMHGIPESLGTAVNVQAMVFGNLGDDSATGVAFTRNPSTGEPGIYGEYLRNAQGEDVVAGVRTPEPIARLAEELPEAYRELEAVCERLERHFRDMQDVEFTIQRGKLWMLQTRTGKRTARAMVRIAVDLVREGLIDERTAVQRLEPAKLDELMHPTIDPDARPEPIAKGLNASPGAAIGKVAFSATEAEKLAAGGDSVILVRVETSPEDIAGMKVSAGILTARGGMTSHAAVVARGMGKPCVTACSALRIDLARGEMTAGDVTVRRGDTIAIDGSTGEVFVGSVPLVPAKLDDDFATLMGWVDAARRLKVRTNADTPTDARTARAFGAEGIGLCRTEHMFFGPERILAVRQMILAEDEAGRRAALAKILPMQRQDFADIFRAMDGLPVTIRLLDPPLHEFLPHPGPEMAEVAAELGVAEARLAAAVDRLREVNPMLGHRGCRLAISHPEIYQTQARAIAEAAVEAAAEGVVVQPEIMIPFVSVSGELERLRRLVAAEVDAVLAEAGADIPYLIGTMIELPRACMVADRIAEHADFFSFGTNDLTQTTYGFSRDDAGTFLSEYLDRGLLPNNPFVALDREGVGQLIRIAVDKGRGVKRKLKVGICGEHGGEPSSVEFCHVEGFDYVSCSPFRVPIARVAAAQAALAGEARAK